MWGHIRQTGSSNCTWGLGLTWQPWRLGGCLAPKKLVRLVGRRGSFSKFPGGELCAQLHCNKSAWFLYMNSEFPHPYDSSGTSPTEIWTQIAGFKVQSASHYTMRPTVKMQHIFVGVAKYTLDNKLYSRSNAQELGQASMSSGWFKKKKVEATL